MMLLKKIVAFLIIAVLIFSFSNKRVYAYDTQCIGGGVASYVDGVMGDTRIQAILGSGNRHAYFLSPAFNMTEGNFANLANTMALASTRWGQLDGVAGNAYNTFWGTAENPAGHATVMDWVNSAYASAPSAFSGKPLLLTEIGWHDLINPGNGYNPTREEARTRLKEQVSLIKNDSRLTGATFFNGFGTGSPEWSGYDMTLGQTNFSEIDQVCSGNCGKIGINTAAYFSQGDTFYDNVKNRGMTFTVEIASDSVDSAMVGIQKALDRNLIPVVRIGVGSESGGFSAPSAYAGFINDVNERVGNAYGSDPSKKVYFIVGPNEPNSECWATPQCGCETTPPDDGGTGGTGSRTKISGNVKTLKMVIDSNTGAQRTNLPVKNAVVAAYTGRYNYQSGSMGGYFLNYVPFRDIPWQVAKTDDKGNYKVEARKYIDGDATNPFENAVYLAFFCVNQGDPGSYAEFYGDPADPNYVQMNVQGRRDPYLRDLYKVGLFEDVTDLNVIIDCDPAQPPNFEPLDWLNYVNRSSFLECNGNYSADYPVPVAGAAAQSGVVGTIPLKKLDSSYKGTKNVPTAYKKLIDNLEGRAEISAVNSDILGPARILAAGFGTIFPGEMFKPPREGGQESLVSCERIAECNQTLTPEGGSCNSYLSGGPAKGLATPYYNKKLYEEIVAASAPDRLVCSKDGMDYTLSQIQPPWDTEDYHGRYSLPKEYWSDEFLYGVPKKATWGGADYESIDDSFTDDYARQHRFIPGTSSVVANPFRSRNIFKYIPGANMQFSITKAEDMIGTYLRDIDPPFDVIKSPLMVAGGFDSAAGDVDPQLDFDSESSLNGIKYWRIGLQDSLCTTSFNDKNEPTNVTAFPRGPTDALENLSKNFSTSYKYVTKRTEEEFPDLLKTLFTVNLGGAYEAIKQKIEQVFLGWFNPEDGSGTVQPDDKYGKKGTCIKQTKERKVSRPRPTPDGEISPDVRGESTDPEDDANYDFSYEYDCDGDLVHDLKVEVTTAASGRSMYQGGEMYGSYSMFLSLISPIDAKNLKEFGTLNTVDTIATNSKAPGDFPGFGLNAGFGQAWGGPSKDAPYYFQSAVGDPPSSGTYTPVNWEYVDFGGLGVCDADNAGSAPTGHNVKPVDSLINALDASSYAGNYSEENVRRCYNYIIKSAMNKTEDPAFVMATWVEESGASKATNAAALGCIVNTSLLLSAQVNCFVNLQYAYVNQVNHALCRNRPPTVGFLTVQKFMQLFSGGESACVQNNYGPNPHYKDQLTEIYQAVSGNELNESCILGGATTRWDSTCN